MFAFLKSDPTKKLKKQHLAKLEAAMQSQRNGDIKTYSVLMTEVDAIYQEIQRLEAEQA